MAFSFKKFVKFMKILQLKENFIVHFQICVRNDNGKKQDAVKLAD